MYVESQKSSITIASNVLGHKWTAEILHVLSVSPQRFCQIQRAVGGVNPRTLSARLDDLEQANIISHQPMPGCAGDQYQLEQKGRDLLPAIEAMTNWGKKYAS
jgi:DNA-binding HxlR family transcriptional regulator